MCCVLATYLAWVFFIWRNARDKHSPHYRSAAGGLWTQIYLGGNTIQYEMMGICVLPQLVYVFEEFSSTFSPHFRHICLDKTMFCSEVLLCFHHGWLCHRWHGLGGNCVHWTRQKWHKHEATSSEQCIYILNKDSWCRHVCLLPVPSWPEIWSKHADWISELFSTRKKSAEEARQEIIEIDKHNFLLCSHSSVILSIPAWMSSLYWKDMPPTKEGVFKREQFLP